MPKEGSMIPITIGYRRLEYEVYCTTAPSDYDVFLTIAVPTVSDRRAKTVERYVLIARPHVRRQLERYESGMYRVALVTDTGVELEIMQQLWKSLAASAGAVESGSERKGGGRDVGHDALSERS